VGYAGTGGGVPMWEGRVGKGQGRPLSAVPGAMREGRERAGDAIGSAGGATRKGGKEPGTPA
jgi:hypothetical protein